MKNQKGSVIIEALIVCTFMVGLFIFLVEYGRALEDYITLNHATFEGLHSAGNLAFSPLLVNDPSIEVVKKRVEEILNWQSHHLNTTISVTPQYSPYVSGAPWPPQGTSSDAVSLNVLSSLKTLFSINIPMSTLIYGPNLTPWISSNSTEFAADTGFLNCCEDLAVSCATNCCTNTATLAGNISSQCL